MQTQPRVVHAKLKFLKWQPLYDVEKPFQIFINIPEDAEDKRNTNLVFENVDVTITDVRSHEDDFTLDQHGFTYGKHHSMVKDFTVREYVEEAYLPEMEVLLRQHLTGADQIFFFDWRLRKNAPEVEGTTIDLNDLTSYLRPALHVHVDQSPMAVLKRVQRQLPAQADELLRGRIRVINIWRPLVDAIEDYPLAICDASTISEADFVEADHVRRHYTGSTMYLKHNANQQFYYMSRQGRDDVLIFKNFDSQVEVHGRCAPHASFLDPFIPQEFIPRQSIEVRALVFTLPKDSKTENLHGD